MLPEDYNFYSFLVDVIIPIGTFVFGLLAERKWHVIGNLFQIHDESKSEQSQKTHGSNSRALQARDIYGDVSLGDNSTGSVTNVPEQLPYKENQFVETVERMLGGKNVTSTFSDRYKDGYKHLRNSCPALAASSYLSAFLQTKETFLTKANYRDEVNESLIQALEGNFSSLQGLSDTSTDNIEELKRIVSGIENTMGSLFGYFIS